MKLCPYCGVPLLGNMLHDGYECPSCGLEFSEFGGHLAEQPLYLHPAESSTEIGADDDLAYA